MADIDRINRTRLGNGAALALNIGGARTLAAASPSMPAWVAGFAMVAKAAMYPLGDGLWMAGVVAPPCIVGSFPAHRSSPP